MMRLVPALVSPIGANSHDARDPPNALLRPFWLHECAMGAFMQQQRNPQRSKRAQRKHPSHMHQRQPSQCPGRTRRHKNARDAGQRLESSRPRGLGSRLSDELGACGGWVCHGRSKEKGHEVPSILTIIEAECESCMLH